MEQNAPFSTFTEPTNTTQTQPEQKNDFASFVGYFLWFFLTGAAIWILMEMWKEPFILSYTLTSWFFNIAIVMTIPSIVASSLLAYRNKKVKHFISIVLLATAIFFIISFFVSGENGLGVMYYAFYIILAFILYGIVVMTIKAISRHFPNKLRYLLGGITLILFLIIGLRIVTFSNPDAISCSSLNVYGRSECFAKLAERNKEGQWCYAIETDSYAPIRCIEKIGKESLTLTGCNMLKNVDSSTHFPSFAVEECAEDYFSLHREDLSYCETTAKGYIGNKRCINLILKANQNARQTSDCSTLTVPENKIYCYNSWQKIITGSVNVSEACKLVTNRDERDMCYYAYFYDIHGISNNPAFERVCRNITNIALRDQCLDLVKN